MLQKSILMKPFDPGQVDLSGLLGCLTVLKGFMFKYQLLKVHLPWVEALSFYDLTDNLHQRIFMNSNPNPLYISYMKQTPVVLLWLP